MKSRIFRMWVVLLILACVFPACGDDGNDRDADDDEEDENDDDDDDDDEPVLTPEDVCPSLCEHVVYCRSLKNQALGALKDCEVFCAELVAGNETLSVDQTALECYELTECVELENCLAQGTLEIDYTALCKTYCDRAPECSPSTVVFDVEQCKADCEEGTSPDFATCALYYEDCEEMKTCMRYAL